jgi:hypothetical protein
MKKISFFLVLPVLCFLFIVMASCNDGDTKTSTGKKDKYEETKENLAETEKKNPVRFLAVTGNDKKNLIGQTVVKGSLKNKATVASYKDVEVELSFFSKTGTLLEKDIEIVYETVAPGKETDFKTKYFAPKGTDSVALKVLGAKSE